MTMRAGLWLTDVAITRPGATQPLFQPLTLHVSPGQIVAVMGPSGCGKSSLLAWLGGTLPPQFGYQGTARLDGQDLAGLAPEQRHIGILFQDDVLFPHLTVAGNLAFGLPPGLSRAERRTQIEQALYEAELHDMGLRDTATLSGGQRARVALMRSLLAAPRALLLDEPFSKLDPRLRADFRAFMMRHAQKSAIPVLMVTHDPADAEHTLNPPLLLQQP